MSNSNLRQRFLRDGCFTVPRLIDEADVAQLRALYDDVLERRIDCGEDDRMLGNCTRQIMNPSRQHAGFRAGLINRCVQRITSEKAGFFVRIDD